MTDERKVLRNEEIEKVSGGSSPWTDNPLAPIIFEIINNPKPKDPSEETDLDYIRKKIKENRLP